MLNTSSSREQFSSFHFGMPRSLIGDTIERLSEAPRAEVLGALLTQGVTDGIVTAEDQTRFAEIVAGALFQPELKTDRSLVRHLGHLYDTYRAERPAALAENPFTVDVLGDINYIRTHMVYGLVQSDRDTLVDLCNRHQLFSAEEMEGSRLNGAHVTSLFYAGTMMKLRHTKLEERYLADFAELPRDEVRDLARWVIARRLGDIPLLERCPERSFAQWAEFFRNEAGPGRPEWKGMLLRQFGMAGALLSESDMRLVASFTEGQRVDWDAVARMEEGAEPGRKRRSFMILTRAPLPDDSLTEDFLTALRAVGLARPRLIELPNQGAMGSLLAVEYVPCSLEQLESAHFDPWASALRRATTRESGLKRRSA